jgi:hypothetical protein
VDSNNGDVAAPASAPGSNAPASAPGSAPADRTNAESTAPASSPVAHSPAEAGSAAAPDSTAPADTGPSTRAAEDPPVDSGAPDEAATTARVDRGRPADPTPPAAAPAPAAVPEEATARVDRARPVEETATAVVPAQGPAPEGGEGATARVDRTPPTLATAASQGPATERVDWTRPVDSSAPADHTGPVDTSGRPYGTREFTPEQVGVKIAPSRPPRSALGAALLNLSGLGVGFGYLGRWLPAVALLVGTVLLVVLGYAVDASTAPVFWAVLLIVWLVAAAVAAWRLGARYPAPPPGRGRVLPVLFGALLVVALVGGFVGYRALGDRAYTAGVAAQTAADCATAVPHFDDVTGLYRLTLSSDVAAARDARGECQQFTAAGVAADQDRPADAVRMYHDFAQAHPASVLTSFARDRAEQTYVTWARGLRAGNNATAAIDVYRDLIAEFGPSYRPDLADTYVEQAGGFRASTGTGPGTQRAQQARSAVEALLTVQREFADTPAVAAVVPGLSDTYAAANGLFAARQFCDGQPVLDYFAGLARTDQTAAVVDTANSDRATDLYECGLTQYNGADYSSALDELPAFMDAYPNDPRVAQAHSALIAATVLDKEGGTPLPLPAPITNNNVGPIEVLYYNDTDEEEHVYVAGPTAHEFVLPACPDCSSSSPYPSPVGGSPCDSPDGKPSLTLRLRAGDYHSLAVGSDGRTTDVDSGALDPGFRYTLCVYSTSF